MTTDARFHVRESKKISVKTSKNNYVPIRARISTKKNKTTAFERRISLWEGVVALKRTVLCGYW